ncbi:MULTISPECIES: Ldh family oxidoreductase [unclassified Crossiella]|uniref:Ldh family oxidoreductase n=1 Tax=unclassified Crossiella TaxID=2620835 RepID=UPI001FFECEC4|nr:MULTISPECIES: Ldh family oxidoreductase [unclassified Crossiella]MCK2241561.1 Ldh family oxidoreductase [Crossiella sp. S99.2]MCK2255567.1 Ldh family oxidoreductase [Crossiella sp. S99.1]
MTTTGVATRVSTVDLLGWTTEVFRALGLPPGRARAAAAALCHGDLTGLTSHGLANLTRLYLPLFQDGRADPAAEPVVLTDLGAAALVDARRALGLWQATEAMADAVDRARTHGIGLVSVRGATHFGCAGHHTALAARHGMIGLLAGNCGGQRIAHPPGGTVAMLGTNPLSVAAPAGAGHPFVLDMSTTVVPTGRIRAAARAGESIPPGWLSDVDGAPVTDPAAFDRGEAQLRWLGGDPETGAYKGFGLGLVVEILGALLSGAGTGPSRDAYTGDRGQDDDIGYAAIAIAPAALRHGKSFQRQTAEVFGALLDCPSTSEDGVRYPGWHEGERAASHLRDGLPIPPALHAELHEVAELLGIGRL